MTRRILRPGRWGWSLGLFLLAFLSLPLAAAFAQAEPDVWAQAEAAAAWPQYGFTGDLQSRSTVDWSYADAFETVYSSREILYVKNRVSFSERFSAILSGVAEYNLTADRSFQAQYSRFKADLEELYADVHLGQVDLRLGQQVVTWGVTDVFTPTDTINSVNYSAMIDTELGHTKIPNLMAKVDYFPDPHHHLEGIVIPFFRPSTIDVIGGDWSIFGAHFPLSFLTESLGASSFGRSVLALLDRQYPGWDQKLADRLSTEQLNVLGPQPPADNFSYWEAAVRYGLAYSRITCSASYFYGFDDVPTFYFSPELKHLIQTLAAASGELETGVLLDEALKLDPFDLFQSEYKRAHQLGLEFTANLGPSVLRAEGTYVLNRRTYDTSLNVVETPQLTYTVSIDYTFPKYVIFNAQAVHVYNAYWREGLITPRNTVFLIGYLHGSFLDDQLEAYLQILYDATAWSVERWRHGEIFGEGYQFSGKVSYLIVPDLSLGVGTIYFNGPDDQLFGLLNEKSFAFVDLKYSF
jgi:hypothetical protein